MNYELRITNYNSPTLTLEIGNLTFEILNYGVIK